MLVYTITKKIFANITVFKTIYKAPKNNHFIIYITIKYKKMQEIINNLILNFD